MAFNPKGIAVVDETEDRLYCSQRCIGLTVGDGNIQDQLIQFLTKPVRSSDALLQRRSPEPQGSCRRCSCGGDILREIHQPSQIAAGELLRCQSIGQKSLIPGQLGFGFQHLQLGVHTCVVTSTGIPETDQGGTNGILTDTNTLVGFLQTEISRGCFQAQISQGNDVCVTNTFVTVAGGRNLRNTSWVNDVP